MKRTTKLFVAVVTTALICAGILAAVGAAAPAAPSDGKTVAAPASSSGSAALVLAATESVFTDVPADADYAEAVAWCYEHGLMNGTGGTNFSPDATLNRAMVATILYRAAGEPGVSGAPAFEDTKADDWYSNAVVWASQNGIVTGYGDGTFGTDDPITQEQLDVMIRRYKGENPVWTANPALAVPATRAEAAVAFYSNLGGNASGTSVPSEDAKLEVVVGDAVFTATLADTEAAREFAQMLPMTVSMSDYGGFEKVGPLGKNLTANNSQITTVAGDIVLYNGNNIVMFYGSNSWSYTRLAKIDDLTGWADALGSGSVSVTFRLA